MPKRIGGLLAIYVMAQLSRFVWNASSCQFCLVPYSYRPLFFHIGQQKFRTGDTIDNALREKMVYSRQTAEDYQRKILMGKMLTN